MAVKIRLSRIGTKNAPVYRIVATDVRNKRDGKALDILGTYDPLIDTFAQFHTSRLDQWLSTGALITDAAKKLHKRYLKRTSTVSALEK